MEYNNRTNIFLTLFYFNPSFSNLLNGIIHYLDFQQTKTNKQTNSIEDVLLVSILDLGLLK